MSDFDPRYYRSPKNPPGAEVVAFEPEEFSPKKKGGDDSDLKEGLDTQNEPIFDPFEEFQPDKKLDDPLEGFPSLDGLFKPFDLASDNPDQDEFGDMFDLPPPVDFAFEDLDTRNPDVVRTLEQAEVIYHQKELEAAQEAALITQKAQTEAKALVEEAEAKAKNVVARAAQEAEESVAAIKGQATAALEAATEERAAATRDRALAEAHLAAVADRISGLDDEWKKLETETSHRRAALTAEEAEVRAELEAARLKTLEEAKESGYKDGLTRGLEEGEAKGRAEGLKAFQDQVEGLVTIMERMENIYRDLWKANEPMMIKLAIEAAEQILNKELGEAKDLAARAFEACVDFLSQAKEVTFLARPEDIAQLEQAKAQQRARLGALVRVHFQPDDTLGPGDLIVESDVGRLDATVKHRADQVLDVLRQAFAGTYEKNIPQREYLAHPEAPDDDFLKVEPLEEDDDFLKVEPLEGSESAAEPTSESPLEHDPDQPEGGNVKP